MQRYQKGQVLLIMVLIMVVALTVGLSLASRSIINLKNATEESDSQKAFQAAEAGVDIALQKGVSTSTITIGKKTLDNNAVINQVVAQPIQGSHIVLNNDNPITQDNGIDVWLTNYPDYSGTPWTGSMYIFWGSKAGCQDAALEVIVISGTSGSDTSATVSRYGIDPCGSASVDKSGTRADQNHFSTAATGTTVNGKQFNFGTYLVKITNGLMVRVIPLYSDTPIAIVGKTSDGTQNHDLPVQGRVITSTGSYGSTERKVVFFQGFPMLSSAFYYGLFNP